MNDNMKFQHILFVTILLCFLTVQATFAQQAVLSGSGVAAGSEGTATFSVGQVAFHSLTGTEGMITEGVQQPYEVLIVQGIGDEPGILLECTVCPNPAESYVKLSIENPLIRNLRYQLCNLTGVILENQTISDNITTIPMDHLTPGIYILSVLEKDQSLKKFKIIKK